MFRVFQKPTHRLSGLVGSDSVAMLGLIITTQRRGTHPGLLGPGAYRPGLRYRPFDPLAAPVMTCCVGSIRVQLNLVTLLDVPS